MDSVLRDALRSHILIMVENKTKLTAGFTDFYKGNGGKENVLNKLNLSKGNSWKKKLQELFPGEFSVTNKGIITRKANAKTSKSTVNGKNKSGSKTKISLNREQSVASVLENHIQKWIMKTAEFTGKPLGRKAKKKISVEGIGKPCPTCNVQMVLDPKNKNPFRATIEHIIPLSIGGDNTYTGQFPQLVAMCFACNQVRNKIMQDSKSDLKNLVRFLIGQVHGPKVDLDTHFMKRFEEQYRVKTGRKLHHREMTNQEICLVQAGFCGNHASSTSELVFEMFGVHAKKIIILLEQKDANLIDLDEWNLFAPEIVLVPNGNDNIQVSALERVLANSNNSVCMIDPAKSSRSFERILQSQNIAILRPALKKHKQLFSLRAKLAKCLPWNWINSNRSISLAESKEPLQTQTTAQHKLEVVDGENSSKPEKEVLEKIKPRILDTIMQMGALDYTTRDLDGETYYFFNKVQVKLPPIEDSTILQQQVSIDVKHKFTPEQYLTIEAVYEKICSEILTFESEGKPFKASNLSRVYSDYGGGVEFKKMLGLPISTKLHEMFELLFGDEFVISGSSPNWNLAINSTGKASQEE